MQNYKTSRGENIVDEYLESLKLKDRMKVFRALEGLDKDKQNLSNVLDTRLLRKPVWELKVGKTRALYIYHNNDIYVLHMFTKKSQKTEQVDMDLAISRAKEILKNK
jgi:Phage-related protein